MGIESFLKADKSDPDWTYSPEEYHGKKFKVIDAKCLQIIEGTEDLMVLRLSPNEADLLCKHLQIISRDSSKLDLFILCEGDEHTQQVFVYNVTSEPNSILNIGIFVKNGKLNKHIFDCEIYENSVINIFGLSENTMGGSSEVISKIYHAGTDAESNVFVNCFANNKSRTIFQGHVKIQENMEGSFTQMSNDSLIGDATSQAFSIPQFSIDCGNTEAGQSCDVGKFNEHQLWYLQSRGIELEDAKKILIAAHQDSVLNLIQYNDLKEEIKEFYRED